MGVKDFFIKQVLKHKMRNVPEGQRNMMMEMVEKHPEFFKKIADEVEKRKKSGQTEIEATLQVMRQHQSEFQNLMRK